MLWFAAVVTHIVAQVGVAGIEAAEGGVEAVRGGEAATTTTKVDSIEAVPAVDSSVAVVSTRQSREFILN